MRFDLRLLNFLAIIGCAAAFATPTLHGGSVDPAGAPAEAGDSSCGAIDFLAPHGIENFSQHYIDALEALLCATEAYESGDFAGAQGILDALWAQYPVGSTQWNALPRRPFGINLGTPPCYYGLRMLTDATESCLANPCGDPAPRKVRLTVLLVGQTHGIEPRTEEELENGEGIPVVHELDPRVEANDYAAVHESLELFTTYVRTAMTQGGLDVETRILPLPDVDLPVHARVLPGGGYYAGLDDAGQVWPFVPAEDIAATDWWWILYPSHVPEQYPDFEDAEFITGGMGVGANAGPFFIIDDRWIVRKPPHLGDGEYSTVERSVYLPQWVQHEFFHHLYRSYPEFGLEEAPHQWFNRSTWPPDFEGRYEPDYYHESLYKRLHCAEPGLHAGLRYATVDAPWSALTVDDVLGTYRRTPVQNPWHVGDIRFQGPQLEWRNTAGVSWDLEDDLANGALLTGPDCPYYGSSNGDRFGVVLERDAIGDLTTDVAGFSFLGEVYGLDGGCSGDVDGSGRVDFADILRVLAAWGPCPRTCPTECAADVDGNRTVDFADLLEVLGGWGPC